MVGGELTLTDQNENIYTFPRSFWIDSGSIENNSNILNSFYAAGGKNIADGFLVSRTITITGVLMGDDNLLYEEKKRTFFKACLKGGKLKISNDSIQRFIEVGIPSFTHEQEQGQQLLRISATFIVEFPFWQDDPEIEHLETLSGDGSFTVSNLSGSDFIIRPRFQFVSNDTGGLPSVKLTNRSDGGARFEYNDPLFQYQDILLIDSSLGTVQLNSGDRIQNFRPANFLRLQPGNNIFDYEGGACILSIFYRKVYVL